MARLLDYDPTFGIARNFHYDAVQDEMIIETKQDVSAAVELSKAEFAAVDERAPWKGDLHKVGQIPMTVVAELQRQGIWYDDQALRRWLDDPANRAFRTRTGRLSR